MEEIGVAQEMPLIETSKNKIKNDKEIENNYHNRYQEPMSFQIQIQKNQNDSQQSMKEMNDKIVVLNEPQMVKTPYIGKIQEENKQLNLGKIKEDDKISRDKPEEF